MAAKGVMLSAGAGALVAMAGIYLARRATNYFSRKPRIGFVQNNIFLSTRCSWLLAELGVEGGLQVNPPDCSSSEHGRNRTHNDSFVSDLERISEMHNQKLNSSLVRQERDYQVVKYTDQCDHTSQGELSPAITGCWMDDPGFSDCDGPYSQSSIPTCLINDEFTMIEGAAICMYLADAYGIFLPDPEHRAEYYSWIVYSAATFDGIVKNIHVQMIETAESERSEDVLQSALGGFNAFARALSDTLANSRYLCGDRFTAADCVLGFTLWWAYTIEQGRLLSGYPVLLAYLDRLQQRPAFQKSFSCNPRLEEEDHGWEWRRYFMACLEQGQDGDLVLED